MSKFKHGRKKWDKKPATLPPWPESIDPLSREEETEAIKLWQNEGDYTARDRIIQANIRFVVSVAKPWLSHGLPLSDMVAEGIIGLLIALDRFDTTRGLKFISYAVWWIRQKMVSAVHNNRIITVPENYMQLWRDYRRLETQQRNNDKNSNFDEIAEILGLNADQAHGLRLMLNGNISLNTGPQNNDDLDRHIAEKFVEDPQALADVEDGPENQDCAEKIDTALAELDEREQLILARYYGLDGDPPQTLSEIGQQLNLTRERVRQIKGKIFDKLQHVQPLRALHAEMEL